MIRLSLVSRRAKADTARSSSLRRVSYVALCVMTSAICASWAQHVAAQPAAAAAAPASGASSVAASPAPDKVYPPLPTLAMLPPSNSSDDDAPAAPAAKGSSHKKGSTAVRKNDVPSARLVVSDASRTYLNSVEQDIDHAMQK
jgi:hypothetical protein